MFKRLRSKFKPADESKSMFPSFVVMTVLYLCLLLLGLIAPRNDYFGLLDLAVFEELGVTEFISMLVYALFTVFWTVTPTYFLYLSACRPFHMAKWLSRLFLAIGIIGTVGLALFSMYRHAMTEAVAASNIYYFVYLGIIIAVLGLSLGYTCFAKGLRAQWYVIICVSFTFLLPVAGVLVMVFISLGTILFYAWVLLSGGPAMVKTLASDSDFVRGYRQAAYGEKPSQQYRYSATVTNSAGCSETIYSDDKRRWYSADGSYRGTSNDDGRTINLN